jgi:hypothetical protein
MNDTTPQRLPTSEEVYQSLPYHYSRSERQPPVVRIPVTGPAPYNTLAVVRTHSGQISGNWQEYTGIGRGSVTVPTNLVLTQYDPRRPEQQDVKHSSMATIRMIQIATDWSLFNDGNADFVWAVDAVQPKSWVDETGRWHVTVDLAWAAHGSSIGIMSYQLSSWVLCWEPPGERPTPSPEPPVQPWRWPIPEDLQPTFDSASLGFDAPRLIREGGKVEVQPHRRRKRTEDPKTVDFMSVNRPRRPT